MRINRRRWFAFAGYGLAFAMPLAATLAVTAAPKEQKAPPRSHRLVLQINSDDPTTMRAVISTSVHLTKYYKAINEGFMVEIVGYNAGLHMFRADTSPVQDLLKVLRTTNPDIRFVICEATKMGMERNEGRLLSFVEGTTSAPNGPAYMIGLQEAGWSYIRS
ncbi:MAG: hypothetical protein U0987_10835 [Afipia sp.]|nr:hypothetical protein [Afipia sp.]